MPRRMRGLSFPVSVMICQRDSTLRGGIPLWHPETEPVLLGAFKKKFPARG